MGLVPSTSNLTTKANSALTNAANSAVSSAMNSSATGLAKITNITAQLAQAGGASAALAQNILTLSEKAILDTTTKCANEAANFLVNAAAFDAGKIASLTAEKVKEIIKEESADIIKEITVASEQRQEELEKEQQEQLLNNAKEDFSEKTKSVSEKTNNILENIENGIASIVECISNGESWVAAQINSYTNIVNTAVKDYLSEQLEDINKAKENFYENTATTFAQGPAKRAIKKLKDKYKEQIVEVAVNLQILENKKKEAEKNAIIQVKGLLGA